jgi:hypothetical protein
MHLLESEITDRELSQVLAMGRRTTSAAITALLQSHSIEPRRNAEELYTEAGFGPVGHELYRAQGEREDSPCIYLSHSAADQDALILRPLGWYAPSQDGEALRDLLLDTPRLPTGGYALARVGDRDLIVFLDHLPTQQLDLSELHAGLLSARLAGAQRGVDDVPDCDGWFSRPRPDSVVEKVDRFLLARPTGWARAPHSENGQPGWARSSDPPIAASYEATAGVFLIARAVRSFLGMPPLESADRLLRTNLGLLDGAIAAVRDGAQGALVILQRLCCDDLDEVELERSVSYVERVRIRGSAGERSALQLLGMVQRCGIERPERKVTVAEAVVPERPEWPSEVHLGQTESGESLDLPVTDFLTHAFVCGGSGSGKTIVCKNLIEEFALAGIPSIVIDLKGDLSSLACVPTAADSVGVSEYLARLHGESAGRLAPEIAEWAGNVAKLYEGAHISTEELESFRSKVRYRVLTPRSEVGIPLALSPLARVELDSFAESGGILGNRWLHELVEANLRSLVEHIGLSDGDTETLIAALIQLLESAQREGLPLSGIEGIETLVRLLFEIADRTTKVNFLPTEWAIKKGEAENYARAMNARLGGTFRYWFDGEHLSIDELISTQHGRVPINVVNLSMLPGSAEQAYAVAQTNAQIIEWMRRQPGAQRPRLVYCIDEIAQEGGKGAIFPPYPFNPITKPGLNLLLKQGRAFGVSCLLATQNAKDIDYKGLGQCDTWVIGRLKTKTDIERLQLGLEAAQVDATHSFGDQIDNIVRHVAALSVGHFVIKTRASGVVSYHQRWIRSIHERLTPELLENWVRAEELAVEQRTGEAEEAWNRGEPEQAIALLEEVITQEPYYSRIAQVKLRLCEWFFRTKQWGRVAEYAAQLRNTVRSRGGFELVHYYEGMALFEQGAMDPARAALERFVAQAAAGSSELAERSRERLQDLFVAQDDYEALEETVEEARESTPGRSRLLAFCHTMKEAIAGWPVLRGRLDGATVLAAPADGEGDEVRYAKKGERSIHAYVAEIRRRLGDLSLAAPDVAAVSEQEAAALREISARIALGEEERRAMAERVAVALAEAECCIEIRQMADASDRIDEARKWVRESGQGLEQLESVISLYRGAFSAERGALRDWLMNVDPLKFELEIAALFRSLGYDAQATKASGDGGVDVLARRQNRRYVVQCKRYRQAIDPGLIREFATTIRNFDADEGIFVTTSRFTEGCRAEAERHGIRLIDLDELVRLYTERATNLAAKTPRTRTDRSQRIVPPESREEVLRVLGEATGPLLAHQVAQRCGLEQADCSTALAELTRSGEVEKAGRARGTRYVVVRNRVSPE